MLLHKIRLLGLAALLIGSLSASLEAADVKVLLTQGRTAYQTNERIDLAVVRSAAEALPAGDLALTLAGEDGSKLAFSFAAPPVAAAAGGAKRTEHLHLSGWLLRPGKYTVEVAADGAKGTAAFELFSHLRRTDYKLINWGRATKEQQLAQGEDNLGYNLFYGGYANDDEGNFIRAGVDFMSCCTMSGAHQMDLRSECDWSDPLVTKGGTQRVVRRAFIDRTRGNVYGVHFYDEPGLTWEKHPETGETTPHMIRSQIKAYEAAFGKTPISYHKVDPKNPEHVAQWKHWAKWKLGFMDSAWKESQFGVSTVRPDYLSVTQSQYGFSAYTDGYYFNVVRSLPVSSGHGGYHDYGPCYFNPVYHLEMARARDHWKPCWYLPTWYGNTTSDEFRLEQYLSFQTNLQGMMSPPDIDPFEPAKKPAAQGVVESNHLFQRLGPVFNNLPVTKPPVAMLYSLSQCLETQTGDMQANYLHSLPQGMNLPLVYLAGKLLQHQFMTIVEEDVLDGTLASDHKAIILTSISYLDPQVVSALESFISGGGLVLLTGDSTVAIKGAVKLAAKPTMPDQERIDALSKEKKYNELGPFQTMGKYYQGAATLAAAIKPELAKVGIKPVFESDQPAIIASRQAAGDIEYLFAVNATYDETSNGAKNASRSTAARLTLADDGRPVYDAVVGGVIPQFQSQDGKLVGNFRFGPGQMRVIARTARPIGKVQAATPVVVRELVLEKQPIRVELAASLTDSQGRILSAAAPVEFQVIDPLGEVRFQQFRATKLGSASVSVPLGANDPAGKWTVVVRDLLANTEDTASFQYAPPARAASLAGATRRALMFGEDANNIFRFARQQHAVTIVKGSSAFNNAAAERIIATLAPWGIKCKTMDLAEAAKARNVTDEEARTWVGLAFGRVKPGNTNPPSQVGFAVEGPTILLGNPADHPIIAYLEKERFLPYKPDAAAIPGGTRGYVAWQRDGVQKAQESITLVAYDEEGMKEAVGTLFEAVAGLEPLTRFELPKSVSITPAQSVPGKAPAARVAWQTVVPDRVVSITAEGGALAALSHDGSLTSISAEGKMGQASTLDWPAYKAKSDTLAKPDAAAIAAQQKRSGPARLVKLVVPHGGLTAVAYWGGRVELVDAEGKIKFANKLPQDVTALASSGDKLVVGLANGQVLGLAP